jgi:hypothetical protein
MAITIQQINTSPLGDPFTILYQRFNLVANAMSTQVLTSSANTIGAPTIGNVALSGIMGATVVATPTIRGGSVAVANDLIISSNVGVQGDHLYVGNSTSNTIVNSTAIVVNNASIANLVVTSLSLGSALAIGDITFSYITKTTSNTSNQTIDNFSMSVYRSAEYLSEIKDNVANNFQVSKILLIHDGVIGYMTEYGIVVSNSTMGVMSASANTTDALLTFMPVSNNTTLKMTRTVMKI